MEQRGGIGVYGIRWSRRWNMNIRGGVIRMKILSSCFIPRTDGRFALKSIARDALHTLPDGEPVSSSFSIQRLDPMWDVMNRREWVVSMKSSWTTAERERVDRHDETLLSSSFSANEFSHEYVSAALMTEFITYRVEMYRTVRSWRTEVAAESVGRLPKRVRRRCFSEDAALDTKKGKWELRRSERWK